MNISPLDGYKQMIDRYGDADAERRSWLYLSEKYFESGVDTNLSYSINRYRRFIPCQIYTFSYSVKKDKTVDYFDHQPIVLSLRSWKSITTKNHIESGFNLNLIPPKIRIYILELLFQNFQRILVENERSAARHGEIISAFPYDPDKLWSLIHGLFSNAFGGKTNAYMMSLRHYIGSKISDPKRIDLNDWSDVGIVVPNDIIGSHSIEIYDQFWKKFNKK